MNIGKLLVSIAKPAAKGLLTVAIGILTTKATRAVEKQAEKLTRPKDKR